MTKSIYLRFLLMAVAFLVAFSISMGNVHAESHTDDEHEDHVEMEASDDSKLEKMQSIIVLLQQLVGLLEQKVVMSHDMHTVADDHEEADLSGIHIMASGEVMLGDGTMLHDATVNEEGMIILADGDIVKPTVDLRVSDDHEDEHDADAEVSMWIEIHDDMTHVHYVDEEGTLVTFFVDPVVTDEDAVIAAIVAELELDEHVAEELLDFDAVIDHSEIDNHAHS